MEDCQNLGDHIFDRRYQITAKLGQGGMGTVYRAFDTQFREDRALKVMKSKYASDPDFQELFRREAKIAHTLAHPGLVRVLDYNPASPCPYLVMELINGPNLADHIKGRIMPLAEAVMILQAVSEAVAFLHHQKPPIIHRDIKPSNILLKPPTETETGYRPVLTDFGLAKLATQTAVTQVGRSAGTPGYMAPEQQQDAATADARSDIFALGVVFYELVAGVRPFKDKEAGYRSLYSPQDYRPDLPDSLQRIILRALALEPAQRYQQVQDLIEALHKVLPEAIEADLKARGTVKAIPPPTELASGIAPAPISLPSLSSDLGEDQIQVRLPDREAFFYPVGRTPVTIGRDPASDLPLDSPKVSWNHACLDYDPRTKSYTLTDLGSRNKTYLKDVPAAPYTPTPWLPHTWATLGGCALLLIPKTASGATPTDEPGEQEQDDGSGISGISGGVLIPYTAYFPQQKRDLRPGQLTTLTLRLINNRRRTAEFDLEFKINQGEKRFDKWLKIPRITSNLRVGAGATEDIQIPLEPPSQNPDPAGAYELKVIITPDQPIKLDQVEQPDQTDKPLEPRCNLELQRVLRFTSKLEPLSEQEHSWRLTVENRGNAREEFLVKWWDPSGELTFKERSSGLHLENSESRFQLVPQQSEPPKKDDGEKKPGRKEIEFNVARRIPKQFGEPESFKFQVEVAAELSSGKRETREHQGDFVSRPLTPAWVPILAAILILLGGLALIGWVWIRPQGQIIAVAPELPAVGEPLTVRWTTSGYISRQFLNGTELPTDLSEFTFPTGLPSGEQTITLEVVGLPKQVGVPGGKQRSLPEFLVRPSISTWIIGVTEPLPTPQVGAAVIEEFTVSPEQVIPGEEVALKWRVSNADTVQIDIFGDVPPVGKQTDQPQQTTRYTLSAANQDTTPVQKVITVLVVTPTPTPPPTPTVPPTPAPPPTAAPTEESGGGDGQDGGDNGGSGGDTPQNSPPVAQTITESIVVNSLPVSISIAGAISDPDGDPVALNAVFTTAETRGVVEIIDDTTINYTPDPGFSGQAKFFYTVVDGQGGQATAEVIVTVGQ